MAHYKLQTVYNEFRLRIKHTEELAALSHVWPAIPTPPNTPRFRPVYRELVFEISFLNSYVAWEAFLEESFILYLMGKIPPKGRGPGRVASPQNRASTELLIIPENQEFVDWASAGNVVKRSERFFKGGRPYSPALKSVQHKFNDMKTLRNAIAHSSTSSQKKFKNLVRQEIGAYPQNMSVGGFLATIVAGSHPPQSYLDQYIRVFINVADQIIPI